VIRLTTYTTAGGSGRS